MPGGGGVVLCTDSQRMRRPTFNVPQSGGSARRTVPPVRPSYNSVCAVGDWQARAQAAEASLATKSDLLAQSITVQGLQVGSRRKSDEWPGKPCMQAPPPRP
jgi:hypothetical protein